MKERIRRARMATGLESGVARFTHRHVDRPITAANGRHQHFRSIDFPPALMHNQTNH
jgi:hypothetical protein